MRFVLLLVIGSLFSPLYGLSTAFLQNLSAPGSNGTPQIAVAASGQAMAVWINTSGQTVIQGAFFDGSIWLPPFTLATGSNPKVGIDQNGNATIVWVSSMSQIYAARFTLQNLTSTTLIASSASSPSLAVNPQGVAVIVWISTPYQILARSFNPSISPNGAWGPTTTFMATNFNSGGTYPASFGLGNTNVGGLAVWLNGPTGLIQSGFISIP